MQRSCHTRARSAEHPGCLAVIGGQRGWLTVGARFASAAAGRLIDLWSCLSIGACHRVERERRRSAGVVAGADHSTAIRVQHLEASDTQAGRCPLNPGRTEGDDGGEANQ
jgi:hypothetical protein